MVAGPALVLRGLDMAVVKRLVHREELHRRHVGGLAQVAVAASDGSPVFACVEALLVTTDAVVVIDHHVVVFRLPAS